jgi:hypothetical protein
MEVNRLIECARYDCDVQFTAATHNQKYCSAECCRVATNRRIMEKYYDRRDQRLGKVRYCSKCKTTKLSRYNDGKVCSGCEAQQNANANKTIADMLMSVSWAV